MHFETSECFFLGAQMALEREGKINLWEVEPLDWNFIENMAWIRKKAFSSWHLDLRVFRDRWGSTIIIWFLGRSARREISDGVSSGSLFTHIGLNFDFLGKRYELESMP